jgi:3-hydroxybutyrate dehydrogenase
MNAAAVNLEGRVALVTGAGNGIGREVAFTLASAGAAVCCVDLDRDAVEAVAASIRQQGGRALALIADVAAEGDVDRVHEDCTRALGTVQILVNNAGVQYLSPVEEFPIPEWDRLNGILLRGPFLYIRRFVPGMTAQGWGRIINMTSIHAVVASPFKTAYVSAKHGLLGLTRTVALEVATRGITVNAVSPGYTRTRLTENQVDKQAELHGLSRQQVLEKVMLGAVPQKEIVEPEELAQAILFLCSESARHITGNNLMVDGGWTAA